MKSEPDLSPVPANARRLLLRCLEKDPGKRLRDIGDYADLLVESAPAETPATGNRVAWAITAIVSIAALSLAAWIFSRPAPLPRVTRFEIHAPPGSFLPRGVPAPSPDGRMLAYTVQGSDGVRRIHIRRLDSTESRALPGTEDASHPFWSPDGQSLAFVAGSDLKRVDLAGGAPRTLGTTYAPWQGSWGSGGILYPTLNGNMGITSAEGGPARPAITADATKGEASVGFPDFLSDGQHFLIRILRSDGSRQIELASLGSAGRKTILSRADAPVVARASNGKTYFLYRENGALLVQEFEEKAAVLRGRPFRLVDQVGSLARRQSLPTAAASADVLAYQTGSHDYDSNFRSAWYDRSGKMLQQLAPGSGGGQDLVLSPDGRLAAFDRESATGSDIWLVNTADGSSTRLTFAKGQTYSNPAWSPDGKRIAFASPNSVYIKDANGSGAEEPVGSGGHEPLSWSRDGGRILTVARNRLFLLSIETKQRVPVGPEGGTSVPDAKFSPDARYFAFSSGESGRSEVYVQAVPPANGKWQISSGGGSQPRWRKDGKELFFVSTDRKLMAVDIQAGTGGAAGAPRILFPLTTGMVGRESYDVAPDGQRFLISSAVSSETSDAPIPWS